MSDERAAETDSRSWYRRPQAVVGVVALLVPLAVAAALVVDALTIDADRAGRAPDTVENTDGAQRAPTTPEPESAPDTDEATAEPDEPEQEPVERPPPEPPPEAAPEPAPEAAPEPAPRPPPEPADRGPEPEPQRIAGNGSGRTPPLVHDGGLAVFTMRHRGKERFGMSLEGDGRRVRLVSRAGDYDGSRAIALPAGEYPVQITADGDWAVSLRQPRHSRGAALPVGFTGGSDQATGPFTTTGGELRVRIHHEGEGPIVVRLLDAAGSRSRQLVRARGPGTATRVGRAAAGHYLFDVQATAPWSIEVRESPSG